MNIRLRHFLTTAALLWSGLFAEVSLAPAQNYYPPSPVPADLGFLPGAGAASQIGSVNPIAGDVGLSFPLAQLPPGPNGFTTGVRLVYDSAFYTAKVDDNGDAGQEVRIVYGNGSTFGLGSGDTGLPDFTGSGWSYTLRYKLWEALTPAQTNVIQWSTPHLTTPDGVTHLLLLTSALDTNNNQISSSLNTGYPNMPIYDVSLLGICAGNNQTYNAVCSASGQFSGTLIYASADSTYIRVESNTVTRTWTAYFADGTRVLGNFGSGSPLGVLVASEYNTIYDRNSNKISVTNFCLEGATCTTQITDQYNRPLSVEYGAQAYNGSTNVWTDTITQPAPPLNGTAQTTSTLVNWEIYNFTGPSYQCIWAGGSNYQSCPLNDGIAPPFVVTSVQFPSASANGPSEVYQFGYSPAAGMNIWGEVHTVTRNTLLSGNTVAQCSLQSTYSDQYCPKQSEVDYTYYFDNPSKTRVMGTLTNPVASMTVNYQENLDGTITARSDTTSYAVPVPTSFSPTIPPPVGGTTTITAPDGTQTSVYSGSATGCTNSTSGLCEPVVYKVVGPDGTTTETDWVSNSTLPPGAPTNALVNPYPQYTLQSLNGYAKGYYTQKDVNGNTTATNEYGWFNASNINRSSSNIVTGVSSSVSPSRSTTSTFYYNPNLNTQYWTPYCVGSTTCTTTTSTAQQFLRALDTVTIGAITTTYSYDSKYTTANITGRSSADSVTGASASQSWTYLGNGNVATAFDPNNYETNVVYDANSLYPTEVDSAYNQPEQRTIKPSYDFNSGVLLSSTDSDNSLETIYTYDSIGRQIEVEDKNTGSGGLDRTTSTAYNDCALSVTVTQNQTGLSSSTYYDALGRVRLTVDAAGNRVETAYQQPAGGGLQYQLQSEPYTGAGQATAWTLTISNAGSVSQTPANSSYSGVSVAGASTSVRTFQGTAGSPPGPWSSTAATPTGNTIYLAHDFSNANCNITPCSGPTSDFTDQAGNTTYYGMDGLGRLVGVLDAAGNTTTHNYNAQDNVTQVVQGGQTRAFTYSLGRLWQACNTEMSATCSPFPSRGTETYTYDNNGNVLTYTNAKGVKTTYAGPNGATHYDGLNRPLSKSYSDSTPSVNYTYDKNCGTSNPWVGALCQVNTAANSGTIFTYDGYGRVLTSTQTVAGTSYQPFRYTYTLADELTQIQYPSGRQVNYNLDGYGRLQTISGPSATYATVNTYTPAGGIASMSLLNGLTEGRTWNDRLQPTGIQVSNSSSTQLLGLGLFPCASLGTSCASGNNGNLQAQTISAPALALTQNYSYDVLNRLQTATETPSSWYQTYGYTASGNRYINPTGTDNFSTSGYAATAASQFNSQNQLTVDNAAFDSSGNQTGIGAASGSYAYTWDAEGRITSAASSASVTAYVYDGEGQRVQKITCPPGTQSCTASTTGATVTSYVYDAAGNLAAEYGALEDGRTSDCGTAYCYVSVDHLGSTRLLTDANGNVQRRYDYLPFGEEAWAGSQWGGRTSGMGYQATADGFNPKFTGQQRDTESLLDYFHARYYAPYQGRFVSPDPGNAGADMTNPQTWNGYSYTGNNPLNITDPSGLGFWSSFGNFMEGLIGDVLDVASGGIWAVIQAAVNGTAPPSGVDLFGPPGLSNLGGCGGPLGNCGTLGAGPVE